MPPEVDIIYLVLRDWATAGTLGTYSDLSRDYQTRTGVWFEPHGSWDVPLGELNNRLHAAAQAPAMSALVASAITQKRP